MPDFNSNNQRPVPIHAQREEVQGVLYLVSVPIGNPQDITLRALHVLEEVSAICCEDTRVARTMLDGYHISTRLLSLQERARSATLEELSSGLKAGRSYAVISDCGTPVLADPGLAVVRAALAIHARVTSVPGASALLAAAAACGFPACPLYFAGFPPRASADRAAFFKALASQPGTIALYETKKCLKDTLKQLCGVLGEDRSAALCQNLTMPTEMWNRTTLGQLLEEFPPQNSRAMQFVIVISGINSKLC